MKKNEDSFIEFIIKYENGKPTKRKVSKLARVPNGCVNGPPCPTCIWSQPSSSYPSGLWCTKEESWPCPGWP